MKTGWHWPKIEGVLCGTMTDRERLGLPDAYMASRFEDILPEIYQRLRGKNVDDYLSMVENKTIPLAERLVAGNMLALIGDPRINLLQPAMVAIQGGDINIGLNESEIAAVMSRFAHIGLDEKWIRKECPRHSVKLKDFRIAKYPVTNAEYRAFLQESRYAELPRNWAFRRYPLERSNHPVFTVTATAADTYANWLST
jgi:hypothetical protein